MKNKDYFFNIVKNITPEEDLQNPVYLIKMPTEMSKNYQDLSFIGVACNQDTSKMLTINEAKSLGEKILSSHKKNLNMTQ